MREVKQCGREGYDATTIHPRCSMPLLNHSWLVAVMHTTQHPEVVQSYIDMYVCTTEFPQNGFTKQQLVAGLSLDCCAWLTSSQTNLHSSDANFDCCTHNGHHYLDYVRQLHMLFMFYAAWRTVQRTFTHPNNVRTVSIRQLWSVSISH